MTFGSRGRADDSRHLRGPFRGVASRELGRMVYNAGSSLACLPPPQGAAVRSGDGNSPLVMQMLQSNAFAWLLLFALGTKAACGQAAETRSDEATDVRRTFAEARAVGRKQSAFLQRRTPQDPESAKPNLDEFANSIRPLLRDTCVPCHGAAIQEGHFRIDTLNPNLVDGTDIDWWIEVQAVLTNGEMPPPDDVSLSDVNRAKIIEWLSNEIQVASMIRRASAAQSSFRRMTRYEFNYALQDLLGLPYEFANDLPPEANSEDGFRNSSELLQMSVSQLETCRLLARKALLRATVRGERPPVLHWGITMQDAGRIDWAKQDAQFEQVRIETADEPERQKQELDELDQQSRGPHPVPYYHNLTTGRTVRATWHYSGAKYANRPEESPRDVPGTFEHVAILPRGAHHRFIVELGNRIPDEGIMRVRVRAARADAEDTSIPTLQLLFGWQASNEGRAVLPVPGSERAVTASPDQPEFLQWDVPLGEIYPRNSVRKTSPMGAMPNPSEYIRLVNNSVSQGPIRIDYVEVAAPVYDDWPPDSHRQIFLDSEHRNDEDLYAREVLTAFMQRAWRRTINADEIDQKLQLFRTMRPACDSFEETMVEVLSTILASPQFLYLMSDAGQDRLLPARELATRLSLFLWCSIPDAELHQLAENGRLSDPDVLGQQVDRMLADDRATRFSQHFVPQWLDLQLLEFRTVPRALESLKRAMQREPVAVFDEMLNTDASVLDFLHADYTVANERLALHYDLPNVKGNHFRRVLLPADSRRGGLLTQAGLLTMNSAGDDSHPLKRGVWLLENLLNDPPPPPPPAVPEIDLADPEIAKMTLKEQIEDHRNHAACLSCHARIDPWGIAFENYDALGRWRDQIRGRPVDATSTLFNRQTLHGMDGLKRFLLEHRQDQFVRAMVHKLTTYALGRRLTFADRSAVDEITSAVRQQGDGLKTMIRTIVMSELFRTK